MYKLTAQILSARSTYLSPILAVSLSFKVLKMFGLLFSGKDVNPWTSELTIAR